MKKTLGSIESFTGGLFASTIVKTPGASLFFKGSVVAYADSIKSKLGIDVSSGVISKKTAIDMALKGKVFLGVDTCVSFTGNAGPTSQEDKKVGLVYIAINENAFELILKGNRNSIRKQAVEFALNKLQELKLL